MTRKLSVVSLCAGVVLLATVIGANSPTPAPTATATPAAPGYSAHLDQNGQFTDAPEAFDPTAILDAHTRAALSTSGEDLVEVPNPKGGYMVDLQGRFQCAVVAHKGPDGKVTVQFVDGAALVSQDEKGGE